MKKFVSVLLALLMLCGMTWALGEGEKVVITYSYWGTPE